LSRLACLCALTALAAACPLTPPSLAPAACDLDEDCAPDQTCLDGQCAPPSPAPDGGPPPPPDGGAPFDGGPPSPDAGAPDPDAGPPDAGAPLVDAGVDAGIDAGPAPDCFTLAQDTLAAACDGCARIPARRMTTAAAIDTFVAEEITSSDAGPPACWCAIGNLDLDGSTINNLGPLSNFSPLRGVTGDLRVDQVSAVNLTGVDEVEAVGGNLSLLASTGLTTFNLDALAYVAGNFTMDGLGGSSISGPEALRETCGSLILGTMSSANTLDGFNALERVGGDFTTGTIDALGTIPGLSSLVEVEGDLELGALPSLNAIDGLGALERVDGDLSLAGDSSLNRVDGLTSLRFVGGALTMTGLGSLNTVAGLSSLEEVVGFWDMTGASSLPNLDGIESLRFAGQMKLEAMPSLTDIEGLSSLEEVTGELKIKDTQIGSIEGIDNLTTTDHLRIEGTGVLAIRGLRRLTDVATKLTHSSNNVRPRCYADRLVAQFQPPPSTAATITNTALECTFLLDTFGDGDLATNPEPGIGFTLVSGDATESGGLVEATPTQADPVILAVPDPDAYYASVGLRATLSALPTDVADGVEIELGCVDPDTPLDEVGSGDNPNAGIYARVVVDPAASSLTLEAVVPGAGSSSSTSLASIGSLELDFDGVNAAARVGATERTDDMSAANLDRCRLFVSARARGANPPTLQIGEVTVRAPVP
jgi:hypothetical protein